MTLEAGNRRLNDSNVQAGIVSTVFRSHVRGPFVQRTKSLLQLNRKLHRILIATRHCNRLIATLPTIAIWTVMHRAAVKLLEVFDLRQFIDEAGREQKHATDNAFPGLEDYRKSAVAALDIDDFHFM